MFDALYWAINTLTTVGPGDLTPIVRLLFSMPPPPSVQVGASFLPVIPSLTLFSMIFFLHPFSLPLWQTSAGRFVSTCTVLIGAVLVPLQLSEIASAAMQAQREVLPSKSSGDFSNMPSDDVTATLAAFDVDMECTRCHLTVHQRDARYCRNCAELLKSKRFD